MFYKSFVALKMTYLKLKHAAAQLGKLSNKCSCVETYWFYLFIIMVIDALQVLQDALVSSSWSVEAAMALLFEGGSVGDKKKRPANIQTYKKGSYIICNHLNT